MDGEPQSAFLTKPNQYYLTAFLAALIANVGVAIIVFFFFVLFRTRKGLEHIYIPRLRNSTTCMPLMPDSYCGWIPAMLRRDEDDELLSVIGADFVLYLKFLRGLIKLSIAWCILGLGNAFLNAFGGSEANKDIFVLSMANIPDGDNVLWGDAAFYIVFNITTLIYVWNLNREAEVLRQGHFDQRPGPHALLLKDIALPQLIKNERTPKVLKFLTGAKRVFRILNTKHLDHAVRRRDKTIWRLRHAYLKFGMDHHKTQKELHALVERNNKCLEESRTPVPWTRWIFATYASEHDAHTALLTSREHKAQIHAELAPLPEEVRFRGLYSPPARAIIARVVINILVIVLGLFYTFPVGFFTGFLTVTNESWLQPIIDAASPSRGIAQGIVPPLGVIIFVALLPFLLKPLAWAAHARSEAEVEKMIFRWYFFIMVIAIYLAAVFASPVWLVVKNLGTTDYGRMTRATWPVGSLFFLSFFLLRGITAPALRLLRPFQIIVVAIATKRRRGCCHRDPRATRQEVEKAYSADPIWKAGKTYSSHILVILVAMSFGVAMPLFMPIAFLYFSCGYVSDRYKMMFVFRRLFETGGAFWPLVVNRIMFSLLLAQLSFLGLLGIKKSYSAILIAPLMLATLALWIYLRLIRRDRFSYSVTTEEAFRRRSRGALDDEDRKGAAATVEDSEYPPYSEYSAPSGDYDDEDDEYELEEQEEVIPEDPSDPSSEISSGYSDLSDVSEDSQGGLNYDASPASGGGVDSPQYSPQYSPEDGSSPPMGMSQYPGASYSLSYRPSTDATTDGGSKEIEGLKEGVTVDDFAVWDGDARPDSFAQHQKTYYHELEDDRLGRVLYLGAMCRPFTRVATEYIQPTIHAARINVTAEMVLADLKHAPTGEPNRYGIFPEDETNSPHRTVFGGPGVRANV